jgi:cell wall-associated NlpC family hydrolase
MTLSGAPRTRLAAAALAVGCLLLSAGPGTPPAAAMPPPTPRQVQGSAQDVVTARTALVDAQTRAEAAVEAYDGAVVMARRAERALTSARTRAQGAAQRAAAAQAGSDGAEARVQQAVALAAQARGEHVRTMADVATARSSLARFAAAAYRDGGVSPGLSLVLTGDPAGYLTARAVLERNGLGLEQSLRRLAVTEARAGGAERQADGTTRAAVRALTVADATTASERDAVAVAQGAQQQAVAAEQAAARSAAGADAARRRALAAVRAAAGRARSAQDTASDLAVQAAAARQAAVVLHRRAPVAGAGTAADGPGTAADRAVSWALREIGVPYSWGGGTAEGPSAGVAQGTSTVGFDCSGLTAFAYARVGIHLEHWTGSQWTAGPHVDRAELRPGDLVFFAEDVTDASTIHHVGLYVGDGQMVEAPHTGGVVQLSSVDRADYAGAVRVT